MDMEDGRIKHKTHMFKNQINMMRMPWMKGKICFLTQNNFQHTTNQVANIYYMKYDTRLVAFWWEAGKFAHNVEEVI